jgi:hypothetical protein
MDEITATEFLFSLSDENNIKNWIAGVAFVKLLCKESGILFNPSLDSVAYTNGIIVNVDETLPDMLLDTAETFYREGIPLL